MTRPALAVLTALLSVAAACSEAAPDTRTTYWKDAKPVLAARCEGCHDAGGIGPFDLSSYATAKAMASSIVAAAQNRSMPPWMPSEASPRMKHERRLSEAELATLQRWLEEGTIEGDPATQPPPRASDIVTIEPTLRLGMAAPYKPDASLGDDDYRCFVLDPQLTTDAAVTGFDIRPGNRRIVHHVILFRVAERNLPALDAQERKDAAPGYTCFGDAGVDAQMVGAWVPGITATRLPAGTGVVIKGGERLVMQVHYNLLEDKAGTDQTEAVLELQEARAVSAAYIIPLAEDLFRVAPGEVKTVTTTLDTEEIRDAAQRFFPGSSVVLHGVAPHMHLHGQAIRVTMTPTNGAPQTLIDIPAWDFHWQQFYFYEQAIPLVRYANIELSCTFDNRAASQPRVNGQPTEPKELRWGEGTLEEMCLNFFYITFEY
jgi:hypothetical protein